MEPLITNIEQSRWVLAPNAEGSQVWGWEVMKKESQKSIITYFREATARKVLAHVEKELTIKNLEALWNAKNKP